MITVKLVIYSSDYLFYPHIQLVFA